MTDGEKPGQILVVEDDAGVRSALEEVLKAESHAVVTARTAGEARSYLEQYHAEVIILDLGLPDVDGLDLLPELINTAEDAAIVVMTGRGDIQTVVEAMKRGAESFLVKPVDIKTLLPTVEKALRQHRLTHHAAVYRAAVAARTNAKAPTERELVGSSPPMAKVRELIAQVAPTQSSVVISGESGTGKGIVARLIHDHSRRPQGPFVDLSCAALPGTLVESEIFGHERGAFTDAVAQKPGLLEVANGGTLFLDEIGELELAAQAKLLKVIEDRSFRRLGGVRQLGVDVRFLVATHRDLAELVGDGRFRGDLFYRLNVFQIALPPLRERGEDIIELAYRFIAELNPRLGRQVKRVSGSAAALLMRYPWPGNVRELRNVIERTLILSVGETITAANLPPDLHDGAPADPLGGVETLAESEAAHIERVVRLAGDNLKLAARCLGISRSTLYAKLARLGTVRPTISPETSAADRRSVGPSGRRGPSQKNR